MRSKIIGLLCFTILLALVSLVLEGPQAKASRSWRGVGVEETGTAVSDTPLSPTVSGPFVATLSPAVRDLPLAQPEFVLEREVSPRLQLHLPTLIPDEAWQDPLVASPALNASTTPTYSLSFEGLSYAQGGGASPSDVNGDVGPNHYMQMINATVLNVYDKQGTLLQGPIALNDFWTSGGCASSNSGDGVVAYDHLADRWVVGQFRSGFANGICIAVSTSPDPLGTYYGYEVTMSSFPDYFKVAVWPDGYYIGANQSGNDVHVLDRAAMLNGNPLTMVSFNAPAASSHSLALPSDLDGAEPPIGSPNFYLRFVDGALAGGVDRVDVFEFAVDWVTPANSTFTGPLSLPSAEFGVLCGLSFSCIRQPNTSQRVDSVTEWPMYRLQYRNFGTHEALVNNHAVNVGGDQAGVRWVELRKSGGDDWEIYQESTHAPDANSRWMAGVALDRDGNMAVAYNVSSTTVFPSVRYATRAVDDPLNTLQAEQSLVEGGGSQTGSNRWSDYTSLVVDPVDDCTFWYTAQYYQTTVGVGWRTRIGNFKMPSCGGDGADVAVAKTAVTQTTLHSPITYTLTITNYGPVTATNVTVNDTLPVGTSFVSVTPSANCAEDLGVVQCDYASLLNGAVEEISIVVTAVQGGWLTNMVTVSADETDAVPANNSASASTFVVTQGVDLSDDMAQSGLVGEVVTYTVAITNVGNISDTFLIALNGATWDTTSSTTSLSLDALETATFDVFVTVPLDAPDGAMDVVTVAISSTNGPVLLGEVVLTTTAVTPKPDMLFIFLPIVIK